MQLDRLWGFIAGLLIGAGAGGHGLRLVILGVEDFTARHFVAGSAVLLYGLAGLLVYFRKKLGLYITILGPVSGVTMVTIAPNAQVDTFQVVLGIPQVLALVFSVYLLLKERAVG